MKKTLLILLFFFVHEKIFSQEKPITNNDFPGVFKKYSSRHNKVMMTLSELPGLSKWSHYKIMYQEKDDWFLADYFVDKLLVNSDSIVVSKCNNCSFIFQQLQSKQKELKSENEIKDPCRKVSRMISKGDTLNKIEDLHWISDLDRQVIQFRNKKIIRRIEQLNPTEALKICPESMERRTFLDLLTAIKNAHSIIGESFHRI